MFSFHALLHSTSQHACPACLLSELLKVLNDQRPKTTACAFQQVLPNASAQVDHTIDLKLTNKLLLGWATADRVCCAFRYKPLQPAQLMPSSSGGS